MNLPTLTFLLLLLVACRNDASRPDESLRKKDAGSPTAPADTAVAADSFSFEIIDAPEGTFGYDISMNGKVVIHQPNIPGMPGLKGFASRDDAERVAALVIDKLKNNQMPPTVTKDELKQLGVE